MPAQPGRKRVSELKLEDFADHPVWTWEDDDGDMVVSVDYSALVANTHDALFVSCRYRLANGTQLYGAVSVRMSDRQVYLLTFYKADETAFDFSLQPELRSPAARAALASFLDLTVDDIFPVAYEVTLGPGTVEQLVGTIN